MLDSKTPKDPEVVQTNRFAEIAQRRAAVEAARRMIRTRVSRHASLTDRLFRMRRDEAHDEMD